MRAETKVSFRSVDQHSGTIAATVGEIGALREEVDGQRTEIDNLSFRNKQLGQMVSDLTTDVAMYQAEREEFREKADEFHDMYRAAQADADDLRDEAAELAGRLAAVEGERDTANARAVTR